VADELSHEAVPALARAADRLDELADAAELMGDPAGATRLRDEARGHRLRALELLD
jgi:hypothetical protein